MSESPAREEDAGADSRDLVRRVHALVADAGYVVVNVDATIIAEAPKVMPHAAQMRDTIAACLGIEMTAVNVKATTNEGMGFVGRGEGIAALAVATVEGVAGGGDGSAAGRA